MLAGASLTGGRGAMRQRLVVRLVVVVALLLAVPIAIAPVGAAPVHTPSSKDQCKNDGWRTLTDDQGNAFRNQGQCVDWAVHHPHVIGLADLTGSFTGTQSFTFVTNGCSFVHQVFDATYPGSTAVGTVTLHIEGCVINGITSYAGTFTISTSVGTVSGTATGPLNISIASFDLTLTVTSGTGAFAASTGTLHASIIWPPPFGAAINGSVTAP
jgi:hypothetical protein